MQTRGEIIRQRRPTRRETLEIAIFLEVSFRLIHSIHLYSEKQKYTRTDIVDQAAAATVE